MLRSLHKRHNLFTEVHLAFRPELCYGGKLNSHTRRNFSFIPWPQSPAVTKNKFSQKLKIMVTWKSQEQKHILDILENANTQSCFFLHVKDNSSCFDEIEEEIIFCRVCLNPSSSLDQHLLNFLLS